jgi:hypothetical protein
LKLFLQSRVIRHHLEATPAEPMPQVATFVKAPTEIVFIDAQVPDAQLLAKGVRPGARAGRSRRAQRSDQGPRLACRGCAADRVARQSAARRRRLAMTGVTRIFPPNAFV